MDGGRTPEICHRIQPETKARIEALEGITRGLESMKRTRGKPAKVFFTEFFADKAIPDHE